MAAIVVASGDMIEMCFVYISIYLFIYIAA
jgi:hypothetical protein